MRIANPIYDVVFKYLMNDSKAAKLLLSAIIGQEIIKLEFRATENAFPLQETITVLRMDFNAVVKYDDGTEQLIIIEIQKAKLHSDIMRFRRYLGQQYTDGKNAREIKNEKGELIRKKALPILSIYFLGHPLDYHKKIPVLRIARQYTDVSTGEALQKREEFVESLTHDSIIIQIPALKGKRRTELERLLSVFDQANRAEDYHILNIKEEDVPERYRLVVRRLIQAIVNAEVREQMHTEDEILEEIQNYVRQLNLRKEELEEKESQIQEKETQIQEKESQIQEQKSQLQKQADELAAQRKSTIMAVRNLQSTGFSIEQIAKTLGLSVKQVKDILNAS